MQFFTFSGKNTAICKYMYEGSRLQASGPGGTMIRPMYRRLTIRRRTTLACMHVNGQYHLDSGMETDIYDHHNSAPGRQCQLRHVQSQEHRHHCTHQTHHTNVDSIQYCHHRWRRSVENIARSESIS